MKNNFKYVLFLSLAVLGLFLTAVFYSKKQSHKKLQFSFPDEILRIEKTCGGENMVTFQSLFVSPDFIDIYENPVNYEDDAVKFISSNRYSNLEKSIAIFSMSKLDFDEYIIFAKCGYDLYCRKSIDEDLLYKIIGYSFNRKQKLIMNYKNKNTIILLTEIKKNKTISDDIQKAIESILNGDSKK